MEKRVDRNKELYIKIEESIKSSNSSQAIESYNNALQKMQQIDPNFFGGDVSAKKKEEKPVKKIWMTVLIFTLILFAIIIIAVAVSKNG